MRNSAASDIDELVTSSSHVIQALTDLKTAKLMNDISDRPEILFKLAAILRVSFTRIHRLQFNLTT